MQLYYKIWADAITAERAKKVEKRNWKLYTLIPISVVQGINLLTIFYWMKVLVNHNLPIIMPVSIFNAKPLNGFVSIVLTYLAPFVLLNYLLIFSNDRYDELLKKYKPAGGKLYRKYVLISLGLLVIPTLIVKLYF